MPPCDETTFLKNRQNFTLWKQYDIILSNGNEYPNSTIKTKENENGITGIERITEAD